MVYNIINKLKSTEIMRYVFVYSLKFKEVTILNSKEDHVLSRLHKLYLK